MGDKVVSFPGLSPNLGRNEVREDVVETLERLLEDARSGVLTCLAYSAIRTDGLTQIQWLGEASRDTTGYGIAKLNHMFFSACLNDGD